MISLFVIETLSTIGLKSLIGLSASTKIIKHLVNICKKLVYQAVTSQVKIHKIKKE